MTDMTAKHVLLVCGGRDYTDRDRVFAELDAVIARGRIAFDTVRHGAQRGADTLAGEWAKSRGYINDPWQAEWRRLGKAAGPIRNAAMIRDGAVVGCVAFPGRIGTPDMIKKCVQAGIPVLEVRR